MIDLIYMKLEFHQYDSALQKAEQSTLSWWRSLSCRNQFTNLLCKSMDWFPYDRDLCHERIEGSSREETFSKITTRNSLKKTLVTQIMSFLENTKEKPTIIFFN